ncbi:replicative DNA helicase [Lysinibacillus alkalisoli]|uniref:DNA 5'-3' helicase n=1 Tax=Lysinibacillus alkalisoli TaxID=1911548 RepID=A0A917G2L1_9BACI|nr:replicative DNA helicase [Lysinibacillus alkalisoli]GGG19547.1 replicative DNA helicase [Lysinibacillus alkalisoli]
MQDRIELAEKSVLGSMLKDNYLISDTAITAAHFATHIHKTIFTSMCELISQTKAVDYITLLTTTDPANLGGANYLSELTSFANEAKFEQYVALIQERWRNDQKRAILFNAQEGDWAIEQVQQALDNIQDNVSDIDTDIKNNLANLLERPYIEAVENVGVPTGLRDLDRMLNGFQKKEMTIIAARPSMGKTDVMNQLAIAAGKTHQYLPIIFSIEMSRETLIDRQIATVGGFNRLKMRNPYQFFSDKQKAYWATAIREMSRYNLHIDDRASLTVAQIKAQARKVIRNNQDLTPIIFIDYLQLIQPEDAKANQTQAIGQISWDLKQMSKELNCPVVALSQLSRGVEQRQDKRPLMSDLRDSGNIEQDADVVIFLYRDDYYNKESERNGLLEMIIAKQRNGPTGTVSAIYTKETGRVFDYDFNGA